jgi:hypothetical protein
MSQSFGIAACSYLRRLLENQITPLLQSVYEVRKEEGEDVGELSEVLSEKVAENKIRLANNVLPTSLEVPGDNPLELIYDKLSAGCTDRVSRSAWRSPRKPRRYLGTSSTATMMTTSAAGLRTATQS